MLIAVLVRVQPKSTFGAHLLVGRHDWQRTADVMHEDLYRFLMHFQGPSPRVLIFRVVDFRGACCVRWRGGPGACDGKRPRVVANWEGRRSSSAVALGELLDENVAMALLVRRAVAHED